MTNYIYRFIHTCNSFYTIKSMNAMKNLCVILIFLLSFLSNVSSQSELMLSSCGELTFPINDHTDMDDDGLACESFVTLQNIAFYATEVECNVAALNWVITVDIDMNGVDDVEYRSDLPTDDDDLDDSNNNGIPDLYIASTTNGEAQEIEVGNLQGPESTHSVSWRVSDECGVISECLQVFHVVDMKAPTPFCISVSSVLFEGGEGVEVFAQDVNIGAFDNCTPWDEIRFSFSGDSIVPMRLIDCDDVLNSPIMLNVYFWDNHGNTDFCSVYLTVIPGPLSDCFPYEVINGYVKTEDDIPIENAEVKIICALPEFPKSTFTDADGYYSFNGVPQGGYGCSITVEKEDEYITSVTTLDLVKIVRHILGLQPFTTPYQIIASDVTGDNKVKASDLIMHRKLILGVISEFPTSPPWVFIDKSYQFSDPDDPWGALENWNVNPFNITISPNSAPYNFIGVKVGNIVD